MVVVIIQAGLSQSYHSTNLFWNMPSLWSFLGYSWVLPCSWLELDLSAIHNHHHHFLGAVVGARGCLLFIDPSYFKQCPFHTYYLSIMISVNMDSAYLELAPGSGATLIKHIFFKVDMTTQDAQEHLPWRTRSDPTGVERSFKLYYEPIQFMKP